MRQRTAIARIAGASLIGIAVIACTSPGGTVTSASPSASVRPGPSSSQRPTVAPSEAPVTGEVPAAVMDAVRADLGTRTGVDPAVATVVKAEDVAWPDGSLGCPELGVMYIQVITPGYQVVLAVDGVAYDYRIAGEGDVIRLCEGVKPAGAG